LYDSYCGSVIPLLTRSRVGASMSAVASSPPGTGPPAGVGCDKQ